MFSGVLGSSVCMCVCVCVCVCVYMYAYNGKCVCVCMPSAVYKHKDECLTSGLDTHLLFKSTFAPLIRAFGCADQHIDYIFKITQSPVLSLFS